MLNKFNQFKIGGNRDTVCLSLMLSPLIGQMPLFYSSFNSILYPTMGILGAIGVSYRVLDSYRNSSLINSSTNFISSEAHAKFQNNKDLLVGYTTDKGIPVGLYSEIMTRHISIVGQSGTGKSVFNRSILFQHILTGGGMLHVDGKNDDGDTPLHFFARIDNTTLSESLDQKEKSKFLQEVLNALAGKTVAANKTKLPRR